MTWVLLIVGLVLGSMVDAAIMGAVVGVLIALGTRVNKLEQDNAKLQAKLKELEPRALPETAGVPMQPTAARARITERSPNAPWPGFVPVQPLPVMSPGVGPVSEAEPPGESEREAFAARAAEAVREPVVGSIVAGEPRAIELGEGPERATEASELGEGSRGPARAAEASEDAEDLRGPARAAEASEPRRASAPADIVDPPSPSAPDGLGRALAAARAWLLGGNPVLRIGVVLLFLGLAFLLRYASERGMVPVELRYVGVAVAGAALLGLGWWLRRRNPAYARILQGTGVAVLYLTVFAAIRLHAFISPGLGLALLVAVTIGSATLAVVQNALALAVVAAIGGFAAPVLVSTGAGNHVALFSYLAVLNAGIFAIAWFKAWRLLNMVGFVGTFGIGLAWGLRSYTPALFASSEPFLALFFLMYVAIGLLFARRTLQDAPGAPTERAQLLRWSARQTDYVDGTVMFGPPLVGFGLQHAVVAHFAYGPAISAAVLGVFYLGLARLVAGRSAGRMLLLVETYLALGVIFMTLAIPLAFDARQTSAAWAVEGAGLYWLGVRQQRPLARGFALLVVAGAVLAFLGEMHGGGVTTLLAGPPLGAAMLGGSLLFMHGQIRRAAMLFEWETVWCAPLLVCIGLGFVDLIAPLCFAVDWTVMAWSVAGMLTITAGLYLRSHSYILMALAVQVLGGGLLLLDLWDPSWTIDAVLGSGWRGVAARLGPLSAVGLRPLAHTGFWASASVAVAALVGAWQMHRAAKRDSPAAPELGHALVIWGAAWWAFTAGCEIDRFVAPALHGAVALGTAALSVALWSEVALRSRWPAMGLLGLTLTPVAAVLLVSLAIYREPFADLAWAGWLAVLVVHLLTLRRLTALVPVSMLSAAHVLGCWLVLAVVALEMRSLAARFTGADSGWTQASVALAPALFVLAMASSRSLVWPVSADPRAYRGVAAVTVAAALLAWVWTTNIFADGDITPLMYLPLVNPLELMLLLAIFAVDRGVRAGLPRLGVQDGVFARPLTAVIGVWLFALGTAAVMRAAHHWAGVPYEIDALLDSMWVQAGLSIVWTCIALGLMVAGHVRGGRVRWSVGAALIGVVVIKLFVVELGNSGGLARIISFIGVGVLLLVVGYFAPLPPRRAAAPTP